MSEKKIAGSKGYKTTEFWAMVATGLTVWLNQSGLIGIQLPVEAVVSLSGLVASYVFGRSIVKKADV